MGANLGQIWADGRARAAELWIGVQMAIIAPHPGPRSAPMRSDQVAEQALRGPR